MSVVCIEAIYAMISFMFMYFAAVEPIIANIKLIIHLWNCRFTKDMLHIKGVTFIYATTVWKSHIKMRLMSHFSHILQIIAIIAILSYCPKSCETFKLTVIHNNDFHTRFAPINVNSDLCTHGQKCLGGAARTVAKVR